MFETGIPKTMKAVVIDGKKAVIKDDVQVPYLDDGFMLIKVLAVAANPMDWKHVDFEMGPQGSVLGSDVAGEIMALGSGIPSDEFKVGDFVYSFIHGASSRKPGNGAFAEYCAVDSLLTLRLPLGQINNLENGITAIPEGPVRSLVAAASMPVALTTAGAVLIHELHAQMVWKPTTPQFDSPILIWGGATSVGQLLIQLCKKMNIFTKIITVASKTHEEQLKIYGADEIYDYHDADVINKIKKNNDNIQYLIDAVSNEETIQSVYKCAAPKSPATVIQLEYLNIDQINPKDRRDDVKIIGTLIYLTSGYDVDLGSYHFPANPQFRKDLITFFKFINPKLIKGEIHHIPIKISPNGLDDIPKLLDEIKQGNIHGEKLITVLK